MISEENQDRINNLRKQLHRVKMAILEQRMSEYLGNQLIAALTLRIKNVRV